MRQLALYGKGGIGKSTVAANAVASWAEAGLRAWYVGCDPKADGSMALLGGRKVETFLERMREGAPGEYEVGEGFKGARCLEVGGPLAGVGCAGRGIIVALQALCRDHFSDPPDVVLYDVPGDVVCGGFAAPVRQGFADEVYIVTSGEYLALYAANNICRGMRNLGVGVGGLICNAREVPREREAVAAVAERLGIGMVGLVPRHRSVQECENAGRTVVEGAPGSPQAQAYRDLAKAMLANERFAVPRPMDPLELRSLLKELTAE
ncbi:MAG TPA: nitrogenase iron protein [Methanomassiliicoccales archaeon]|nr:nitrogenase iron protein [Methanomassiliicoccales archaeon]